jgi:hypothetical protein
MHMMIDVRVAQIAFQMGAVYVGEGLANGSSPEESRRAMEAVSALHQASAPDVPLHCVLLEDIFDAEDERLADMGMDKGGLLVNLLQVYFCLTVRISDSCSPRSPTLSFRQKGLSVLI